MTQIAEPKPIGVKQAAQAAFAYVRDLFPPEQVYDLRLEEVERIEDDKFWLVTVGFSSPPVAERELTPGEMASPVAALQRMPFGRHLERQFKQLKINAASGDVVSMKIRIP